MNFVQTFMLFPNALYAKQFQMNRVWGMAILNLAFSFGDLSGRILSQKRIVFNKQSLIYLFLTKGIFFWIAYILTKNTGDPIISSDAFAFINSFLYGLTSGLSSSI